MPNKLEANLAINIKEQTQIKHCNNSFKCFIQKQNILDQKQANCASYWLLTMTSLCTFLVLSL